ncbi:ATP-dependent helicase [Microlunatus parietis]|uniref:DNA 3'-5' helicase n=1 Tax=Microlunatus parietis TaxID=682979 RepID=A0A7Y9LFQ7_9ACTN|nr:ATP-dependent DNA helicase [Microlunatus parietis]NYE75240.1 superfamily I DNA/RNA helicase/RecB family exonuclease [Microlunatus parietis]
MYQLIRTPRPAAPMPELDPTQQRVVDHPGGPLLVLAGPGTGKTTTLVESVVDRIERRGMRPESILVLTFSRRAAAELRTRIAARLGRSVATPLAMTFHSFCYALIRRFSAVDRSGQTIRLLTAPEQEFRVREILEGSPETGRADWPASLAAAFPTRGFAAEVRSVLAKARQLGMDPEDVIDAGEAAGRPEWVSVGQFFDEYLDVLDSERVMDYAELVHRCRILLADPVIRDTVRSELRAVFVDEYQDTDPSQVRLLQAIAGDGRDVVAVGDPDQSIYAFRGAEARGILDFGDAFPTASGERAPVIALGRTRRFGKALLSVSRNLADRMGLPRPLPPEVYASYRNPEPTAGLPPGRIDVFTCASTGAEAEHIADILRSAHLRDGVRWSEMAVLVRSGRRSIPTLSRALSAAGIPIEVAGDEIPLSAELAVRPLLLALQVAATGRRIDQEQAQTLLTSPLGGLDSLGLRRLGRALRSAERAELAGAGLPRLSPELIARAVTEPDLLAELPAAPERDRAAGLAALLIDCEKLIMDGGSAEEALWLLWTGTGWPDKLRREASGGGEPARRADRDLDAICALFDVAGRSEDVVGLRGVTGFLAEVEGQQIPADTLREADLRGEAVRVLTAHRSKGLEWPLVVVAGVQEGVWPDVRRRGSLLEPDRLSRHGLADDVPTAIRIAEERRLFYVACTRARNRLVITAVAGTEGEGDQPSRFLSELGVTVRDLPGRPRRPLTLPALVGELRAASVNADLPPVLREQAALRLARLADARDDDGRPLVPAADPQRWWGMLPLSDTDETPPEPVEGPGPDDPGPSKVPPVVAPDAPIQLSGSQLASALACPRQWFLSRRAQAEQARGSAAGFGSVIHVLAEHGAREGIDPDRLSDHLETVWDQLDFDAKWLSATERVEAESALERFAAWQQYRTGQQLLGTEVEFATEVDLGPDRVRLTGVADRVERDPDGRIRIIDFKTGRSQPAAVDVALQDQLGAYQLAVAQGAFAEVAGPNARPAGAELVYLRLADGAELPKVFQQASLDDVPFPVADPEPEDDPELAGQPTWVHRRLLRAARTIRTETFHATVNGSCRYCPFAGSCPAQSGGQRVIP